MESWIFLTFYYSSSRKKYSTDFLISLFTPKLRKKFMQDDVQGLFIFQLCANNNYYLFILNYFKFQLQVVLCQINIFCPQLIQNTMIDFILGTYEYLQIVLKFKVLQVFDCELVSQSYKPLFFCSAISQFSLFLNFRYFTISVISQYLLFS